MGVRWQPARPRRSKLSTSLLSLVGHKNPSLLHLAPPPSEQRAAGGISTIPRGSTAPGAPKHVLLFGLWGQIFFQVHPISTDKLTRCATGAAVPCTTTLTYHQGEMGSN